MGPPVFHGGQGGVNRTTERREVLSSGEWFAEQEAHMAYRELTMVDVKEVLRRVQAQQSARKIARDTRADRKTVRRYAEAAKAIGLQPAQVLDDDVVAQVGRLVQMRHVLPPGKAHEVLAVHKEKLRGWLTAKPPLRLSKVAVLLERDGVEIPYSTLRRYVMAELGWRKPEGTILLEDPPMGQEAQVDFGLMGLLHDETTGKKRRLWVLLVTLSASRYMFVWPSWFQTTEAVCEGLDAAWAFFGGMPRTIVPDNMSAMVFKADALAPVLVEAFADYAQARGLFVDPARVAHPKDKGKVENQVRYVRDNWWAGEQFVDLQHVMDSARHWCLEVAGTRVHGTTRKVPREVFEALEKPAMLPPPTDAFDVPLWVDAKVHPDHHVQVARALYSVPSLYLKKWVRVRADKKTVKIYAGTELVKMHARVAAGGRSTDVEDYPSGKAKYALRTVDSVLARARERGVHTGRYAERILAGPLPWARMRQGYALLGLCDKFGDARVEAVCQSALSFDVVDVGRITRMLKKAVTPGKPGEVDRKVIQLPLLAPRFARPVEHFTTTQVKKAKKGDDQ